ncbi:MAG: hypothetical protein ACKVQK_20060 [Burkholderiales bacterium]
MSVSHIEQFYTRAINDQVLVQKMMEGTNGPNDFVANAVKEGKTMGYDFTFEEADGWIKKQQEIKASGELSDSQLEVVAGGKYDKTNQYAGETQSNANSGNVTGTIGGAAMTVGAAVTETWGYVTSGSWFSSW